MTIRRPRKTVQARRSSCPRQYECDIFPPFRRGQTRHVQVLSPVENGKFSRVLLCASPCLSNMWACCQRSNVTKPGVGKVRISIHKRVDISRLPFCIYSCQFLPFESYLWRFGQGRSLVVRPLSYADGTDAHFKSNLSRRESSTGCESKHLAFQHDTPTTIIAVLSCASLDFHHSNAWNSAQAS